MEFGRKRLFDEKKGHTLLDMAFELCLPSADRIGKWQEDFSFKGHGFDLSFFSGCSQDF